jgi:hypothetical protein
MRSTFALAVSLLLPFALPAQDERRVSSPNGQVEFRIFVAQPNDGGLGQLAYQVLYRGKPALDLSWMGLDIYNQQPLLGEKPGLTHWSTDTTTPGSYHSMLLEYIQDGTVGRRINVEVRAYDDGVAFRYLIPRVTPLYDIPIHDEGTGFSIVGADAVAGTKVNTPFELPFVTATPGARMGCHHRDPYCELSTHAPRACRRDRSDEPSHPREGRSEHRLPGRHPAHLPMAADHFRL